MTDSCRTLSANCERTIVFTIVCLETEAYISKIVSSFTSDTGLNDVFVHGFVCNK